MAKITPPFVRAPGNYDVVAACEECCVQDFGPSLTQQSDLEDSDINTIVKRFGLTGRLPDNVRAPVFADFDEVYDYKSAMDAIAEANSSFMKMPAQVRARFQNDPQEFLEFCSKPENLDEMRGLGLAIPKPTEGPSGSPTGPTGSEPAGGAKPAGSGS